MKIQFTIVDVNDALVDAELDYVAVMPDSQVAGKAPAAGGRGTISVPDDTWIVTVTLLPREHNEDVVRIRRLGLTGGWMVDNPTCRMVVSGEVIDITAIVGRLRSAPTVHVPDDQIPKMAGDPQGVLLYDTGGGKIYHSLFADGYAPFMRLNHPALKPKTDPGAKEWDRLSAQPTRVEDPKQVGRFFHLEYGDRRSGPRLFLSLYLPQPGPRSMLDCVVFFSPSTALAKFPVDRLPYRGRYPYGMTKPSQEYPRHPQNYLFSGVHLVHQLLAAGSKAALIMPVAPYGDWSLFQTHAGLMRLLLECSLFLHRELLTTRHASVRPVGPDLVNAGGSVRTVTAMGIGAGASVFANFDPVPRIDRVAAAAFSSGCIALQSLLVGTAGLPEGFSAARFGAGNASFGRVFKEICDVDGAHGAYHKYPAFEQALANWYRVGDRRFRLYHAQHTGGDRDSMANDPLKKLVKPADHDNSAEVVENGQKFWAHERWAADGSWSSVRFADGYLSSKNSGGKMPGWMLNDIHHFLPKIAFGHSALLFGRR